MEDVNISKYRAQVVRAGSTPASPGFVVSEGQDPVNPSGSSNYVPYSGAISNVDFGEFGLDTGFITLDTTPTNIPTEQGGIYWDDARSTAALIMNGTLQHIGQDTFFYVKNSTGSSIPKGTAVRFDGTDGASGHLKIAPFLANGTYPSNYFMGVTAEAIANGSFGQVMHFGELTGVNTSGYTAGALLYASTSVAGAFQTTAPVAPNNIVLVAAAINSTNNGTILVRPTYGSNINQDEGVKITSGTTGDLLQLQAGGLWENKTLAQVIGSAYVPSTRTITINGTTQDLSANRTYNVGTVTAVTASNPLFSSGGTTPNITIQQASGSQSGFLSSTDWSTFNGKQNALTNPVTGTGTTNYLPKFTGASTIGNSSITDNGTEIVLNGLSRFTAGGFDTYISQSFGNTINFGYNANSYPYDGWVNYRGFQNGTTQFRNFRVGDGKENAIASFIGSTGNVLINTTTDAGFKLDVNGTGRFSGQLRVNLTTADSAITLVNTSTNNIFTTYSNASNNTYIGLVGNNGVVQTNNDFEVYTGASYTKKLTITSSGNVGIGTASPVYKIHVVGENFNQAILDNTGQQYTGLDFRNNGTTKTDFYYDNTNTAFNIRTRVAGPLILSTTDSERMRITSGGNVGIGTSSPSSLFTVAGTSDLAFTNGTTLLRINRSGSQARFQNYDGGSVATIVLNWEGGKVLVAGTTDNGAYNLQCNGTGVWGAGAYVNGSDRNIKENISTIEKGLEYIEKMNPVRFKYKPNYTRDHTMQTGFIAQELQEVFANEDYLSGLVQNGVHLSVAYQNLLPILVKAIQELKQEIDKLKN